MILDTVLGHLRVFYDDLWGIYKRDVQVFNKVFNIFHNGRGGWVKVGRNGEKWKENNEIMIRIGGYKNGVWNRQ